ncbi:DUF2892 domain-containing protein [Geitlerinema sp. PCC 9228]|jgi:hypothetical protein|uniref:YgaP family membrane protein n=1 Tax=Geitlerinema sp. PCC 9228 TaxID=111611 RepID=UPI0008F9DBE4|nr:DUF2892 domain-containing protein [Geitlerinema sp. PCC 9228]
MFANVGISDRIVRLLLAGGLFYLGFGVYENSALGIGLDVVGGILALTAIIGFCGLYRLLGISTNKTKAS